LAERRRMRYAVRFTNMDVLATVVSGRSWPRLVPPILFALSLAFLFVGLGRPHVERMFLQDRATVILVVDTSRSMQADDVEPTRLAAAQEAIRTFLDRAPDRVNVGLVVFAGEAQVGTPPTRDHDLVRQSIDEIDSFLIYGGTAIGDALQTAVDLGERFTEEEQVEGEEIALPPLAQDQNPLARILIARRASEPRTTRSLAQAVECGEGDEQGPVSILFLSDGAQTRGILQPLEGAALAQEACIPVYTIALGTPEGTIDRGAFGNPFGRDPGAGDDIPVPPDPETLREISEMTGGEFSEARTADALEKAYANLSSRLGREPGESEVTFLFIALAGGLLLLAGAVSVFVAPRLP
ncbi:MAG TPA: VWA domain-containing protein, partial [Gaiellaceae bacterium]|nr:VWA domain-containing protein [Gaiellaceae bacterium]